MTIKTTHPLCLLMSAMLIACAITFPAELSGQCPTCNGGVPPANDDCTTARDLGMLTQPTICLGTIGGIGTPQSFSGTNVCATAPFPYNQITGCQSGGSMAGPAADVWFRFQITGTVLVVQITSSLRGANIGLWQDPGTGCNDLNARNCAVSASGNLTATFTSLNPGVYYLQISGMDTLDQCDFTLTLTNNHDCAACIQQNNLTVSPPPVNGRYQAGTAVTFTYTVLRYNQTNVNWIHGIVPHFGSGWDLSTLRNQVAPQSCSGAGSWAWYNRTITGCFRGISDGPGFFFETTAGCTQTAGNCTGACNPNNPGDNYGDQDAAGICQWVFQWTINTLASCPPGQTGQSLNVEIFNYGDSETGSWNNPACENDPNYRFFATLFCCTPSIITITNTSCNDASDGSVNVLGQGIAPYDYELLDLAGNVLQSQAGDHNDHTFTGLTAGNYRVKTKDLNNCTDLQQIIVTEPDRLIVVGSWENVTCSGSNDGSINTIVYGGTPPFAYQWDAPGNPADSAVSGLPGGIYNVTVTDANGCLDTESFPVWEPLPFLGVMSVVNVQCTGTGTAVLLLSGGNVPYRYLWSTNDTTATIIQPAGTYFVTVTDANQCLFMDSVVIGIEGAATITIINAEICRGDSYFAGGANQTEPGIYFDTLLTAEGCDSIIETHLSVLPAFLTEISVSICEGDSFFAGGAFQTEPGTYIDSFIAASGCDSIAQTSLFVSSVITVSRTASICQGDSFFVGGSFQTQPGFYNDTFATASGCDSILITELSVLPVLTETIQASICQGESFFAGGAFQTAPGTYFDTLTSSFGCDSILITELTVLPVLTETIQASICQGESFFAGGAFQTAPGTYFDTLTSSFGCDSIVTTELMVLSNSSFVRNVDVCSGDGFFCGGAFQTAPGTYFDTLTSSFGCDSIVTTELMVLSNSSFVRNVDVCSGDGFFCGGAFQTVSGIYFDTLTSANGCDSIITTNLNVGAALRVNFDVNEVSCCPPPNSNGNGNLQSCTLDFAGLPHGARIAGYFADLGVAVSANATGSYPDQLIVFNSNLTGTRDPDLQAGIGNIAIFPHNLTDNNHDGLVDTPDDQGVGGTITFTFDDPRTLFGFTFVDNDRSSSTVKAYDAGNNLIATVSVPVSGAGTVQDVVLNISGVKKFTVTYADSRGIGNIRFSCPPLSCPVDLSGFAHGEIVSGEEIAQGVIVTGTSYAPAQFPNAVAIFNSNVNGSMDPDLEAGMGNILILPESVTDANGDGIADAPSDASAGGTLTFTFSRDRKVFRLTLIDNDRNNGSIKAYDANNNLLVTVPTPSGPNGSVQTYSLNVSGVRKLEVSYADSRGVAALMLDCPPVNCCDGNAAATVSGGFPPYQYSWSTGSTSAFSGDSLCAGTYAVTVIDALGCSATDSVSLVHANVTAQTAQICEGDSILLQGAYRTQPGFYYDTLGVTDGCLEILKTQLFLQLPSSATRQVQICQGQRFFAGGAFQSASGVYFDVLVAANGCDSILTTVLTVLPPVMTQTEAQICEGESYFAGGAFQTQSGVYADTLATAEGCDSIVVTNLTVIPVMITNVAAQICEGDSFFAGGAFQTQPGVYADTLMSSAGCDSIVITALNVLSQLVENVSAAICEGEGYFAGGAFQTLPGTYFDTLVSSGGCDSIVITTLSVNPVFVQNISAEICRGESYFAGGAFQTETGTYFDTLATSSGCDSMVITYLTVLPSPLINIIEKICHGDSLFAGGAFQTQSGIYIDTFTATNGCDSIVVTDLNVLPVPVETVTAEICDGESYLAGGAFQTQSGTYFDTFVSATGCDSIVVTVLTVNPAFTVNISAEICEGEAYFAGGAFQTESGIYIDSLVSSLGCDSVVVTALTVNPAYQFMQQTQICEGDSFFAGGAFQTQSGTYVDSFTTAAGCDSLYITELTVLREFIYDRQVLICEGDSFFAGGAFQAQSGNYYDTLVSAGGCDSIVITHLTLIPASVTDIDVFICAGELYFAGGALQSQTGIYIDTFISAAGCDSIVITHLTVSSISLSGTVTDVSCFNGGNGAVDLSVSGGIAPYAYTWSNNTFVEDLSGISAGPYSVTVTDATGCTASAGFFVNQADALAIGGLPAPPTCHGGSDGSIDLLIQGGTFPYAFSWSTGDTTEDISGLTAGLYTLIVTDANGCMATVIIEVPQPDTIPNTNLHVTICEGDSFFAGGAFQTSPGIYIDSLTNADGCDSIVITELNMLPSASSGIQAVICEGDSFFAGGTFQTTSGTYYDTLIAENGCDSIVTTELTVIPATFTTVEARICQGQSYFAGGAFQTVSGLYFDFLVSAQGCDSIIVTDLIVTPAEVTGVEVVICEGDSFLAGGAYQTQSGVYYDTLQTSDGCDSILVWDLIVLPSVIIHAEAAICEGEAYFAGGAFQTQPGTYYDTLASPLGCDSIIITELTVNQNKLTGIEAVLCEGDSLFAGGAYQTVPGTYYDTLQTAAGCDSIIVWDVIELPNSMSIMQASICEGEFYFAGGAFQNQPGIYYDTFLNVFGCDSILITELTVNPAKQTGIEAVICEGDSILIGGVYYTQEGTYIETLQTAAGCDSVLIWDVFVLPASFTNIQATICEGESYFAGGDFQTQTGTYYDIFVNALGCDSVVITDLTVLPASFAFIEVQICEGDSFFAGGAFQTQTGEYMDILTSANGCDSIIITQLSALPELLTTLDVTIADGDSFFAGGAYQTQPGIYYDTLAADFGCDSIIVTNLMVIGFCNISLSGEVFDVSCFGGSEGMIDLTVAGGTLPYFHTWSNSQTTEDISSLTSGAYQVTVIDQNGCTATASFTVNEPAPLAVGAEITHVSCFGGSDGAIDVTVFGGTPPYTFNWSMGSVMEDISGLTAGFYPVTVTDLNTCSTVFIFQVTEPAEPLTFIAFITNESISGASDGAIDLSVFGGTPPYHYLWSTGDTTEDLSNLDAGFYILMVIDDNGCIVRDTMEVELIQGNAVFFSGMQDPPSFFDLAAYPNPFGRRLLLELMSSNAGTGWVMLHDLTGRKMMTRHIAIKEGVNKYELHIDHHLAAGAYMLVVTNSDGSKRTVKTVLKE